MRLTKAQQHALVKLLRKPAPLGELGLSARGLQGIIHLLHLDGRRYHLTAEGRTLARQLSDRFLPPAQPTSKAHPNQSLSPHEARERANAYARAHGLPEPFDPLPPSHRQSS